MNIERTRRTPTKDTDVRDSSLDLNRIGDGLLAREQTSSLRPLDRLRLLADEGSLHVIRSEVTSERMGEKARAGDGVVGGSLRIGGRSVFCFAQDAMYAGGSLGAQHADTIVRVQRLARQPVSR
jgi:acetyl-CoA carboxylase carboxyltransferase component